MTFLKRKVGAGEDGKLEGSGGYRVVENHMPHRETPGMKTFDVKEILAAVRELQRAESSELKNAIAKKISRDILIAEKVCYSCGKSKPLKVGFHRNSTKADGFSSRCKDCHRTYKRDARRNQAVAKFVS